MITENKPNGIHITLKDFIEKFSGYYEMTEDSKKALAIIVATYFEQFVEGKPIWLHIVEPVAGMKTTIIESMEATPKSMKANVITPKTLRSSKKGELDKTIGEENLERINEKVWLFKDFTSILSQNENDRKAIYGDLRELYDEEISYMSGSNVGSIVSRCRTTLITGVTEAIDRQGYNMQIMGERFSKVRLNLKQKRKEIIHRAMVDNGSEQTIKKEMHQVFGSLFDYYSSPKVWEQQFEIKQRLLESPYALRIENLADLITKVRVYCWKDPHSYDSYIDEPLEEHGTRFVKQLTKMAILLTILCEKKEFDEELWQILLKFGEDSCLPIRLEIIKLFINNGFKPLSTEDISEQLDKGRQAIKCRLEELEAAHTIKANWTTSQSGYEKVTSWSVKDDIKKLAESIWNTKEMEVLAIPHFEEAKPTSQTNLDSSFN